MAKATTVFVADFAVPFHNQHGATQVSVPFIALESFYCWLGNDLLWEQAQN